VTALAGPYLESTSRSISELGLANCSSALYPAGSILMTSRATIGAFAIAGQPMAVNQGFIVVRPHDEQLKWWILHDMQSRVDEFVSHANGATFMELSRGKFKALPARLAGEDAMYRFNAYADALHTAARAALVENTQLAALHDTLLPHLMFGRLRVKDAEKQVEAVV
jgi:type I restriction enzyme, S subunit